jgi:hypothetical protein
MKRAARFLLLVLAGWLFALPAQRVQRVRGLARAPVAAAFEAPTTIAVEHVVLETSAMPRVAAAPLHARLPAPSFKLLCAPEQGRSTARVSPRDLRQALRRVQTRRRLPRLSSDDPPWC